GVAESQNQIGDLLHEHRVEICLRLVPEQEPLLGQRAIHHQPEKAGDLAQTLSEEVCFDGAILHIDEEPSITQFYAAAENFLERLRQRGRFGCPGALSRRRAQGHTQVAISIVECQLAVFDGGLKPLVGGEHLARGNKYRGTDLPKGVLGDPEVPEIRDCKLDCSLVGADGHFGEKAAWPPVDQASKPVAPWAEDSPQFFGYSTIRSNQARLSPISRRGSRLQD